MKNILLVEDDKRLSKLIAEYLTNHGYSVKCEYRGDKAIYRITHQHYFLVILDINLPEIDGLQVCQIVRKDYQGYILMLTAREADEDQITGLEFGADDYIKKPINPKVLLARIDALTRRSSPRSITASELHFGHLHINLEKREVQLGQKIIDLKPKEYELLILLASNAGTLLTRQNIMHAMRGIDYDGVDRTIDLRISYLRNKLADNEDHPYRIQTLRNKGYIFQPDAWN